MRTGVRVVAALAVSLAVGGCSEPRAGTLPTPSPSGSVPASPSTSPPTVDLEAGLRSALAAYFDALYAAGLDPANKADALGRLMTPTCPCRQTLAVLRDEARQGRYIDYRYTLRDVSVIDVGDLGGDIRYTVERSAGAERDRAGRILERFAPSTTRLTAHFVRQGSSWLLDRLTEFR